MRAEDWPFLSLKVCICVPYLTYRRVLCTNDSIQNALASGYPQTDATAPSLPPSIALSCAPADKLNATKQTIFAVGELFGHMIRSPRNLPLHEGLHLRVLDVVEALVGARHHLLCGGGAGRRVGQHLAGGARRRIDLGGVQGADVRAERVG